MRLAAGVHLPSMLTLKSDLVGAGCLFVIDMVLFDRKRALHPAWSRLEAKNGLVIARAV